MYAAVRPPRSVRLEGARRQRGHGHGFYGAAQNLSPALLRLGSANAQGNVTRGRVVALSSHGNLVASEKRVVTLVGVDGLVVIDTEDALLVCSADRVQDVKQVIDELERRGWKEHV